MKGKKNGGRVTTLVKMNKARRLPEMADLCLAGKTQVEIAELLGISQGVVSLQLKELRERWEASAATKIGDWVARELAYAEKERTDTWILFRRTNNPRYGALVLSWSRRISELLGLDAPEKHDDGWDKKDWRKYIQENGLNKEEVLAEAERIIAEERTDTTSR